MAACFSLADLSQFLQTGKFLTMAALAASFPVKIGDVVNDSFDEATKSDSLFSQLSNYLAGLRPLGLSTDASTDASSGSVYESSFDDATPAASTHETETAIAACVQSPGNNTVLQGSNSPVKTSPPGISTSSPDILWPPAKQARLLLAVDIRAYSNLLPAVRALSLECFETDVTQLVKKCWILNLLVTPAEPSSLLAFVLLQARPELRSLEVVKVAVVADGRRRGYGRKLIKHVIAYARGRKDVDFVSLSSLSGAVSFYTHMGFKQYDQIPVGTRRPLGANEELVPGQVYMEMFVGKKKKARK